VGLNLTFAEVKAWIGERMKKVIQVDEATGELDHFIIEPFVPHAQVDEYYICIQNEKDGEEMLFYSEGGVDVGDVDSKAVRLHIKIDEELTEEMIEAQDFLKGVPDERKPRLRSFLIGLFKCYRKLNFTYSEFPVS
jgi:ATP citrate (pro-S)-lyase